MVVCITNDERQATSDDTSYSGADIDVMGDETVRPIFHVPDPLSGAADCPCKSADGHCEPGCSACLEFVLRWDSDKQDRE